MSDIIVGKHALESLSFGMYSNRYDFIREYIQNATDSIDKAYKMGLLCNGEEEIIISLGRRLESLSIKDNGIGINSDIAVKKLGDIGNSDKDYTDNRGFRGIGRLAGLGYADELYFITTSKGDNKKSIIKWNCVRLRELLSPNNTEKEDILSVIEEVMSFEFEDIEPDTHFFEVRLVGIRNQFREFFTAEKITSYLSDVAPVDFDVQQFPLANKIKKFFYEKGYPLPAYRICHSMRKKPIFKPFSRSLNTGMQKRTYAKDYVRDIEFVYETDSKGLPLYIGWVAITDFSGQIKDEKLQGIRLRKGNILVGDRTTFSHFFPSEGAVANKMFAGEIHILHPDVIPNTERDDFEPNEVYQEVIEKLTVWADYLNKTYRRGTSKVTSAIKAIEKAKADQRSLEDRIKSGTITSDTKREKYISENQKISKSILSAKKELDISLRKGIVDPEKSEIVAKTIRQADEFERKTIVISNAIVNTEYATKSDLPTSYSKDERKVYQRIIEVIDEFFKDDPEVSNKLREAIKTELKVKKK